MHFHIMASEETNANEAIVQDVAEATRVAIQTMAAARADETQNVVHRLVVPMIKQPNVNWKAEDKYNKLKTSG